MSLLLKIQSTLSSQGRLRVVLGLSGMCGSEWPPKTLWGLRGTSPAAHPKHTPDCHLHTCEGARPLPRRIPPGGRPTAAGAPTCPAAAGGCWCTAPSRWQLCARPPGHSCTPRLETQQWGAGGHTHTHSPFWGFFVTSLPISRVGNAVPASSKNLVSFSQRGLKNSFALLIIRAT